MPKQSSTAAPATAPHDRLLYSVSETALVLGIADAELMTLVQSGVVEARYLGKHIRILRPEIDRLLTEGIPPMPVLVSPGVAKAMGVPFEADETSTVIDPRVTFFGKDFYTDRELAYFFGLTLDEIRTTLRGHLASRTVSKRRLWRLIAAGAQQGDPPEHAAPPLVRRKKAAYEVVSWAARRDVILRDGSRCRYCGAAVSGRMLQVDHVMPRSRGGRRPRKTWWWPASPATPSRTR
jgi:hypothetical protein